MVVSDVQLCVRFMVVVIELNYNTLKCTWEREGHYLPQHSSATPQTSSSAPGRRSCLWPSALQCTTSEWLPHSERQLNTTTVTLQLSFHKSGIYSVHSYTTVLHSTGNKLKPASSQHFVTELFPFPRQPNSTHLCRAAPRSSGRPSWSGCCHSSTPVSSGAESVRTGPVLWMLSAAGCIAATSTRRRDRQLSPVSVSERMVTIETWKRGHPYNAVIHFVPSSVWWLARWRAPLSCSTPQSSWHSSIRCRSWSARRCWSSSSPRAHIQSSAEWQRRVNTMQQRPYRAFLHGEEQCD